MSAPIKQLVVVRRRSGQTVQEFLDYHYQQHGAISEAPSPEQTPLLYFQTHFFDTAYNNAENAQPAWTGHNDSTELWFKDEAHMNRVFGSDHVRSTVGRDGSNFNDFVGCIAMFAQEEVLSGTSTEQDLSTQTTVATYYVQVRDSTTAGGHAATLKAFNEEIAQAFGSISTRIVANVALPDPEDKLKYFQGATAPQYSAAYQVYISGVDRIPAFREAQKQLERTCGSYVKTETAFVTFGVRSVVFDQVHKVAFDKSRQPRLP